MQPYFFPYLGYFQLINCVDTFILYDGVGFIKNGWINRNRLKSTNGHVFYISVPLDKKTSNAHHTIAEVKIAHRQKWRQAMLKSVVSNYKKAPHFEEIFPSIEALFHFKTDSISAFNAKSIASVCELLAIRPPLIPDASLIGEIESSLASLSKPQTTRKYYRIKTLADYFGKTTYINPIGGEKIYERELMKALELELKFIKMKPTSYPQKGTQFISHLSILDVLFEVGIASTKKLLNSYELV